MHTFTTTRTVRHSPDDMFALVADVESYPEFLPLCEDLRIRGRRTGEDGNDVLIADMTVAYKILRETFTSKVVLDKAGRVIEVSYLDGPFRSLENRWTFLPRSDGGCDVTFYIAYEFKSRALDLIAGAAFDRAFRQFTIAFEQRANVICGQAA